MKKLLSILTLFIFAAFVIISCRKDDDAPQQASLVGTWQPMTFKATGVVNGQTVSQTITANACQQKNRVVFNSNGTGTTANWNDQSGTCTAEPAGNFTYSYNPQTKSITITSGADSNTGTVTTLTASQLVYSVNTTYDFNGNNVPATLEISANRVQ